jgi:hypothetical protein
VLGPPHNAEPTQEENEMASKQVMDRQRSAHSVIAAGEANAGLVQEALAAKAKPHLKKGEAAPDFAAVVSLSCTLLTAARDRMVEADAAHEAELADDPAVREARDATCAGLYDDLVQVREMLVGAHGGAAAGNVFAGSTPDEPIALARYAGEVASRLQKAKLPPPRIKGAKLDVAEIAGSLQEKRAELEQQVKAVQREVREAQQTLDAKTAAVADYDETFAAVASALSGLLRLAGKPDLAAKVRPSTRRPGQTAQDAGDSSQPEAPPGPDAGKSGA